MFVSCCLYFCHSYCLAKVYNVNSWHSSSILLTLIASYSNFLTIIPPCNLLVLDIPYSKVIDPRVCSIQPDNHFDK